MARFNKFFFLNLLLVIIFLNALTGLCFASASVRKESYGREENFNFKAWNINLFIYQEKGNPVNIQALFIEDFPNRTRLEDFLLIYKGIKIRGKKGIYYKRKNFFEIKGSCVVITKKRGSFFTQGFFFYPRQNLITGNGEIIWKTGNMKVKGKGFEYFINRDFLKIKKQVSVILK